MPPVIKRAVCITYAEKPAPSHKTHDNTVYLLQFAHKGFNFSNPSARLLSVILKYSLWFLVFVRVGNGNERPNLDQTRPEKFLHRCNGSLPSPP